MERRCFSITSAKRIGKQTSFNLSSVRSVTLASPPEQLPRCHCCGQVGKYFITRLSDRNRNPGRPYHKCQSCDKFLVFCDQRSNDPTNPKCHCGCSSKRQVTRRSKPVSGRLHYVCRLGTAISSARARMKRGWTSLLI
ncbi:hypothetical protein F5X99DRAFT_129330 [Biscogniauxia marginata]|nr:hypothetical protein F5X99DRAFT_129330 [Biscogniauxia marginata]